MFVCLSGSSLCFLVLFNYIVLDLFSLFPLTGTERKWAPNAPEHPGRPRPPVRSPTSANARAEGGSPLVSAPGVGRSPKNGFGGNPPSPRAFTYVGECTGRGGQPRPGALGLSTERGMYWDRVRYALGTERDMSNCPRAVAGVGSPMTMTMLMMA